MSQSQRRCRRATDDTTGCPRIYTALATAGAVVLVTAATAATAAAVIARRRGTYPPPAEAPPRVDDPVL